MGSREEAELANFSDGGLVFALDAIDTWALMPRRSNQSGPLYLVVGDAFIPGEFSHLGDTGLEGQLDRFVNRDIQDTLRFIHQDQRRGFTRDNQRAGSASMLYLEMFLSGANYLRSDVGAYQSRREFLRAAGGTALSSYAFLRALNPSVWQRLFSKSRLLSKPVAQIEAADISELDWLEARNGLFVLKNRDAVDLLEQRGLIGPGEPADIAGGSGHIIGIDRLMNDESACRAAIYKYFNKIYQIAKLYKGEIDPHLNLDDTLQVLKEIVSQMVIIGFDKAKPIPQGLTDGAAIKKAVVQTIREAATFKIAQPSPRVLEALEAIR